MMMRSGKLVAGLGSQTGCGKVKPRLPVFFFMTDEGRLPDPLPVISRLPKGCGVIFRHYGSLGRKDLGARVAALCRKKGLPLLVAADPGLALSLGAIGVHLPDVLSRKAMFINRFFRHRLPLITCAAHDAAGIARANNLNIDAVFLSPVFPTRSHPGSAAMGVNRFAALARRSKHPVMALGGVTKAKLQALRMAGAQGFAGIDLFLD